MRTATSMFLFGIIIKGNRPNQFSLYNFPNVTYEISFPTIKGGPVCYSKDSTVIRERHRRVKYSVLFIPQHHCYRYRFTASVIVNSETPRTINSCCPVIGHRRDITTPISNTAHFPNKLANNCFAVSVSLKTIALLFIKMRERQEIQRRTEIPVAIPLAGLVTNIFTQQLHAISHCLTISFFPHFSLHPPIISVSLFVLSLSLSSSLALSAFIRPIHPSFFLLTIPVLLVYTQPRPGQPLSSTR